MEKRYQVFISSTKEDLDDARQEVSEALLRANCFPAAMELFPAADEGISDYIKEVIRESDYYIVISAGKYGSIEPETGKSYTELEYDYAMEIGKPIIRLLHKDPFNKLLGEKIEISDEGKRSLSEFREKLRSTRMVRLWEHPKELGAEVRFALDDTIRRHPAQGWVRADAHGLTATAPANQNATDEKSVRASSHFQTAMHHAQVLFDFAPEYGAVFIQKTLKVFSEANNEYSDWNLDIFKSIVAGPASNAKISTIPLEEDSLEKYVFDNEDKFRKFCHKIAHQGLVNFDGTGGFIRDAGRELYNYIHAEDLVEY